MKIEIKEFLTNEPNFLIAALVLAYEEDFEPLVEIMGEGGALSHIRQLRSSLSLIKTYGLHEFPISIHRGHILKYPNQVAAAIILGFDHFFAQERTIPTEVNIYGKQWLSTFKKEVRDKLILKNKQILTVPQKKIEVS